MKLLQSHTALRYSMESYPVLSFLSHLFSSFLVLPLCLLYGRVQFHHIHLSPRLSFLTICRKVSFSVRIINIFMRMEQDRILPYLIFNTLSFGQKMMLEQRGKGWVILSHPPCGEGWHGLPVGFKSRAPRKSGTRCVLKASPQTSRLL